MAGSRTTLLIVLAVLALVAGACRDGGSGDDQLGQWVLDEAPKGFEVVSSPATGSMDLDTAATSTEASLRSLRRQLGRTGFQRGYARVWRDDEDFVGVLVYEFLTERRAAELVTFMADELAGKRTAQAFEVPDVPGAKGAILNARSKEGTSLFCQLAWFSVAERAFATRVCATSPNSLTYVIDLTQRQYEAADSRTGEDNA